MLIAARNGFTSRRKWKNPYVTDGLVAMWDGEWNAGGGVHDAGATSWVDLIGGRNFVIANPNWGNDHVFFNNGCYGYMSDQDSAIFNLRDATLSAVIERGSGTWNYDGIYLKGPDSSVIGLGFFSTAFCASNRISARNYQFPAAEVVSVSALYADNANSSVMYGTNTETPGGSDTISYNQSFATIGYRTSGGYNAKGKMYNLRLYNRQLTASEIAANYAVDKARFNLP